MTMTMKEFAKGVSVSTADQLRIMFRDRFRCVLCGWGAKDGRAVTVVILRRDEAYPHRDSLDNFVTLCVDCADGLDLLRHAPPTHHGALPPLDLQKVRDFVTELDVLGRHRE